jgi:hypothetical protein
MNRSDLINCMHTGVRRACSDYGDWSGGESIHDRGIESLITASIARAVAESWKMHSKTAYLSLETPFAEIAHNSFAETKRGALPKVLRGARRADIALWSSDLAVTSVIEVKRQWVPKPCLHDLKRLGALIRQYGRHQKGRLGTGFLVTMVLVELTSTPEAKIREIKDSVKSIGSDVVDVRVRLDTQSAYLDEERNRAGYSVIVELAAKRLNIEVVDASAPSLAAQM